MRRRAAGEQWRAVGSVILATFGATLVARADGERPPPAGSMCVFPERFMLTGIRDGRQLIVTETGSDGTVRDLTRDVRYAVAPPDIVAVTPRGYVRARRPGAATVTVESAGRRTSVAVEVRARRRPLHFANEIVPLLSRNGCNAGGRS